MPRTATSEVHVLEPGDMALTPDDGLVLGNGDLSVAVYRRGDAIIWRLGKCDVWDRRLDFSDDPRPAHIDEVSRGILEEGWKCPPYGGPVEATRAPAKDPARMREICQGVAPSYKNRPYPCPKPVGELALHLPTDLASLEVRHRLLIEDARIELSCRWPDGVRIDVECFIPPQPNVLVLNWTLAGWEAGAIGLPHWLPLWFSLYRWPDPDIAAFWSQCAAEGVSAWGGIEGYVHPKATPLPPPTWRSGPSGLLLIEQAFPADPTFPDGFACAISPLSADLRMEGKKTQPDGPAVLHLYPHQTTSGEGTLVVGVATSSDADGPLQTLARVNDAFAADPVAAVRTWRQQNERVASEFWSHSSLRVADRFVENLWYETWHVRRCHYRPDVPPPGLFLPSSLADYTHWHGDYHNNYNYQSPFWGAYEANHIDLGDAYFKGCEYQLDIGRKIARDYYSSRGVFFQLSAYPIKAADDPMGVVPMGRMAYITGWMANQYWWRYLYTLDRRWLAEVGYPVIRDCALFYTDIIRKGDDGLYHAFPSNQGEDGFSGDAADFTDRPQVMRHMRYCLRAAIGAAAALDADAELRRTWAEIVDCSAPDAGADKGKEKALDPLLPPEFAFDSLPTGNVSPWADRSQASWQWYFGQTPWRWIAHLRNRGMDPKRDWPHLRALLERWRRPNGTMLAMNIGLFGHLGAWTESLGVVAPLQEMMLQSWRGHIEVFPAWPAEVDVSFDHWRAQGAFLVSATQTNGRTTEVVLHSEKGTPCRIAEPWSGGIRVSDRHGASVPVQPSNGVAVFDTASGDTYTLAPA